MEEKKIEENKFAPCTFKSMRKIHYTAYIFTCPICGKENVVYETDDPNGGDFDDDCCEHYEDTPIWDITGIPLKEVKD